MRETPGQFTSNACLTYIVGLPLALVVIIFGLDALIWLLESLPQD